MDEKINKNNINQDENDTGYGNESLKQVSEKDEFNLSELRLSQNFSEIVGVKKVILTVPVRRPGNQNFFRVHPSEDYHIETAVLQLKEENETYLVDPSLWSELFREIIQSKGWNH